MGLFPASDNARCSAGTGTASTSSASVALCLMLHTRHHRYPTTSIYIKLPLLCVPQTTYRPTYLSFVAAHHIHTTATIIVWSKAGAAWIFLRGAFVASAVFFFALGGRGAARGWRGSCTLDSFPSPRGVPGERKGRCACNYVRGMTLVQRPLVTVRKMAINAGGCSPNIVRARLGCLIV
jgi:hypothetical protein